jgi:uncharacterized protein involved in exopolysaccharide biosynthesis
VLSPNILSILFRRKWTIAIVFILVLAVAVSFTLLVPKKYESRMKVFIKHERADAVVSPDSSNAVVRGEVSESDVNSEIELLTSSGLLRQVVLRNGLHRAESAPGARPIDETVERAVRRLSKSLSITPVRKASIIQVVYSSENPARSAAVLSTLADLYLQEHLRVHRTAGTQEFFRSQAEGYGRQLTEAQNRLADFRRRNNLVLLPEQKDLMLRRVMDIETALTEAAAGVAEAERRVLTLRSQLAVLPPRVVTQSRVLPNQYSVERLHTMLAEMQNRRTALLTKFQANDRLVQELDSQIADTAAALARARELSSVEETTDVNPLRQRLEADLAQAELARAGLESRRASISAVLAASRARLNGLDAATADHDGLQREIKQAEDNLLLYAKKREEARIADSLDQQKIANVSIAEMPTTPVLPAKPNVPLNLSLGFLLACFSSLGAAFAVEMNRTTFETEEELQDYLKLPVLAAVKHHS